jgi:C4-type Zn-finger protein
MTIKGITWEHGSDFHAILECEHCGNTQKLVTGYNDTFYRDKVIPAMVCNKCGKNRAGEEPGAIVEYETK